MCLRRLVRCAPPCCERCGAPGPWPVRRCAECSGRRLAFASARASDRLRRRRPCLRRVVEGTRTPGPRGRRRRARRRRAPEAGRRRRHVRSRRSRPPAEARPCTGRRARGRARVGLVDPGHRPPAAAAGNRAPARPAASRAARKRRPCVLAARTVAARGCASSTTSTRRARPRPRAPRSCGAPAHAGSRSCASPAPSGEPDHCCVPLLTLGQRGGVRESLPRAERGPTSPAGPAPITATRSTGKAYQARERRGEDPGLAARAQ